MITHLPPVHGTLEQQSLFCVHVWPYWAQDVPPSTVPASGVLTGGPQVPVVAPGGMVHDVPTQQSAVVVHAPAVGMQSPPPQTKGGEPAGVGTQGLLQQSALVAH